jgi:hypothetical protein
MIIADEEDNERLLELCLSLTFQFTRDPGTAVFFSIAGGRKTMSACLMTAAHLYGRRRTGSIMSWFPLNSRATGISSIRPKSPRQSS